MTLLTRRSHSLCLVARSLTVTWFLAPRNPLTRTMLHSCPSLKSQEPDTRRLDVSISGDRGSSRGTDRYPNNLRVNFVLYSRRECTMIMTLFISQVTPEATFRIPANGVHNPDLLQISR